MGSWALGLLLPAALTPTGPASFWEPWEQLLRTPPGTGPTARQFLLRAAAGEERGQAVALVLVTYPNVAGMGTFEGQYRPPSGSSADNHPLFPSRLPVLILGHLFWVTRSGHGSLRKGGSQHSLLERGGKEEPPGFRVCRSRLRVAWGLGRWTSRFSQRRGSVERAQSQCPLGPHPGWGLGQMRKLRLGEGSTHSVTVIASRVVALWPTPECHCRQGYQDHESSSLPLGAMRTGVSQSRPQQVPSDRRAWVSERPRAVDGLCRRSPSRTLTHCLCLGVYLCLGLPKEAAAWRLWSADPQLLHFPAATRASQLTLRALLSK
ncbi:hypothetical protein TREES_T100014029 [Tupaia chinensis]|uniref:Uncharacterized protein n=1 Tax=Tupaia chinensis TaxID=246437 RepID=L9KPU7_TUPCH|nr:hypothetical protein TREES_T100014029 [Tupaia chinensis]